ETPFGPDSWDLIDGLNAEVIERPVVVAGQPILRLVAVGAGRHQLGAHFDRLTAERVYRATAWIKAGPGVRVGIEARDAVDSLTGKPSNYGIAWFNPVGRSVLDSTGDIIASGVEAAEDDWVKVWVDLRTGNGSIYILIGLLATRANRAE